MQFGSAGKDKLLVHYVPVEQLGPRLSLDMGFAERFAVLEDFPMF